MNNGKTITYNIKVNDLIKAIKEYEYVKIEFYKDGNFAIMSEEANPGYSDEAIDIKSFSIDDFKYCDSNIELFTTLLKSPWFDSFDAYKYDDLEPTTHVNWIKE